MNQIIYQLADLDDIHDVFNHQVAIKSYDPGVALNTCSIYFLKDCLLSLLVRMQQHTKYNATYRS